MTTITALGTVRRHVRVFGLVQGVGFRPFVHQLATRLGLTGYVGNDTGGVFVEVEGAREQVEDFMAGLLGGGPPLARVDGVEAIDVACRGDAAFEIVASRGGGPVSTFVAPDAAVCDDCLAEMFDVSDRRYRYPFITCTNCGPRFTITRSLPYDRTSTTMASFDLCDECASDYTDPAGRRFHAQPLACARCGPRVWLETTNGRVEGVDAVIAATQRLIATGTIVAIKGVGGYHLACDARSDAAVGALRARKHRPDKPFAVMARDVHTARSIAWLDAAEADLLESSARPIVLLRSKAGAVAPGVAPGNPRLGIVLPYAPLHHLLFAPVPGVAGPVPEVLVMTSGNLSDEPICFEDHDAQRRLAAIADAFLVHDRPIHVPCDDSVLRVDGGAVVPVRRSRGYAPMPIRLPVDVPPILAVGGELKNAFCVARGRDAWLSQHIGDMGSVETLAAFDAATAQLAALYDAAPEIVAADLHPGYQSTAWAERRATSPVERVQHHHAHLAALLAEHGEPVDIRAIGVVLDGTGYGTDGTIWGGEVIVGGYAAVDRVGHLRAVDLPGGDAAIRRPYRSALAHLWSADIPWDPALPSVDAAGAGERGVLAQQLERRLQCVPTSSMGRLFDAVSSLLGVRHLATYEAEAAIELEELARVAGDVEPRYRFAIVDGVIDPAPVLAALVADTLAGTDVPTCAAAFHDAVAEAITASVATVRQSTGIDVVGLTGGVFQNAVLTANTRGRLEATGCRVLTHTLVPPNDGGLALGQAAVAAVRAYQGAT